MEFKEGSIFTCACKGNVLIDMKMPVQTLLFSPSSARELAHAMWRLAREAEIDQRPYVVDQAAS